MLKELSNMEIKEILPLVSVYHRKLAATSMSFKRSLYSSINWNVRMLGIKGEKGAGKSFEQIKDEPDSFLAVDDTETGIGSRIPLWLFGFLY